MSEEISKYEVFNKYEEAKKLLLIDYDINKDKRYLVAIEACEKQIPKKPTEHYNWCDLTTDDFRWYCKNCDNNLDETEKHCPNCGQKLDWLEDKDE